jgi:hypothetical protein
VVNGIQLKCLPESATTQIAGQVCMIETQGSTKFIGYDGKYVAGYVRALTAKDQFGVVITEPVSVKASAVHRPQGFQYQIMTQLAHSRFLRGQAMMEFLVFAGVAISLF